MANNKLDADKLWNVAWTYIRTVVDTVREPFLFGKKLNFLIDLDKANKPTSKARKIIIEKIYKDPELNKITVIATSVLVRTVNNFLIKAAELGSDRIQMFPAEKEALKWLKEGKR
jgi:16S rRNA U1498 N3-methylase RsmE